MGKKLGFLTLVVFAVFVITGSAGADSDDDCCGATGLPLNTWRSGYIYPSGDGDWWYMDTYENRWVSVINGVNPGECERDFYVGVWDKCIGCPGTGNPSNFLKHCFFYSAEPYTKCSFLPPVGVTYLAVSSITVNGGSFCPYKIKFQYECEENQCYSEYWDKCYWNGDLCCEGDTMPKQWYCQYENTWKGCTNDDHNICEKSDNGVYICQKGYYEGFWRWRDCSSCYGDCKYPDLTIPDAWLDPPPANIDPGKGTKIYFKIKNLNDADSEHSYINIGYYLDGELRTALQIGYLEALEEGTNWFSDKIGCGEHEISLIADYDGRIAESSEYNNGFGIFFKVNCKDLTVTDIHVNPAPPYAGQPTDIGFKIKNAGNQKITENFYNKIYIDGVEKGTIYETQDIEPDHGIDYHNPLTITLGCGFHMVKAKTDTSDNVKEIDESNNEKSREYYWGCPAGKTCINGECCECTSGVCCDGCHYYKQSDNHRCSDADSCSGDDLCTHYICDGSGGDGSACTIKAGCTDCGDKDCDVNNYYFMEGDNSAEGTSYCKYRDYADCNRPCYSASCQDCSCSQYYDSTQATAGVCQYIDGCSGSTAGTVKNSPKGTPCGANEECDGNGNCAAIELEGDVNRDCVVNIFDLAKVGLCYGCSAGQGCWTDCSQADVKSDSIINIFDLAAVGLNYGRSC